MAINVIHGGTQSVGFSCTIDNNGIDTVNNLGVEIYVGGVLLAVSSSFNLASGSSTTLTTTQVPSWKLTPANINALAVGAYDVQAKLYVAGTQVDTQTASNEITVTAQISLNISALNSYVI